MICNVWLKVYNFKRYLAFEEELNEYMAKRIRTSPTSLEFLDKERDAKKYATNLWIKHGSPLVDLLEYSKFKKSNWI